MRAIVVAVVLGLLGAGARPALAQAQDRMHAYLTGSGGQLLGRVVDDEHRPMVGAKVFIVPRGGSRFSVRTDEDGRYRVTIPAGGAAVYLRGEGHFSEQTMVVSKAANGRQEQVEIQDTVPAAVAPVLVSEANIIPPYSDEALDDDAWTRAWLLLDIGPDGRVHRVKLLHRPGHGLDDIAVRAALALRFEPARNRADKPIAAVILWTFEWPSPTFLIKKRGTLVRKLPGVVNRVHCKGSGPNNARWQRDCTEVDIAGALDLPWLTAGGTATSNRTPQP